MATKAVVFICQLGIVLAAVSDSLRLFSYKEWREDDCRRMLREAKDATVQSPSPPKLSGHWTSSRCEIRPGPEFVLRKYLFRRNNFHAQLFFYADEACSQVTHYISAKGTVKASRQSWRTPGAHESRFSLSQISVIPYTDDKARTFEKLLHRYCKYRSHATVQTFQKFKIFQFTKYKKGNADNEDISNDFDCSKLFNFTMNELQLIRMERRKVESLGRSTDASRGSHTEAELLLGDISTNIKYRRQYRPTHYQTPLKKSKTPECDVCQQIASANQWYPPILSQEHVTIVDIRGDWVSDRCETRPNGQYLTRHLMFLPSGRSWQGVYEFYRDALCTEPNFKIEVKGTYVKGEPSNIISSAHNYVFRTIRLKVTPLDFQMVQYLNSYDGKKCGKSKVWKIGVSQDVTSTKGCVTLGIALPNTEYELMKAEYDARNSYLYVGQRPSDYASMALPKNRPTSFQRPLVKCGATNEVSPSYEKHSAYSIDTNSTSNTGTNINSVTCSLIPFTIVMVVYAMFHV